METDGTAPTSLTRHPARDGAPTWSPDGAWLAFETDRDGDFEIYIMRADGTDQRNLTQHSGASDGLPAWAPVSGAPTAVELYLWGPLKARLRLR